MVGFNLHSHYISSSGVSPLSTSSSHATLTTISETVQSLVSTAYFEDASRIAEIILRWKSGVAEAIT